MRTLVVLALLFLSPMLPQRAEADEAWDAFLAGTSDYGETLDLAWSLREALSGGDEDGLAQLAATVMAATPERFLPVVEAAIAASGESETEQLSAIADAMLEQGVFADADTAQSAADGLRSCSMAGILLRHLIVDVAAGGKTHRMSEDRLMVDGTSSDSAFALHFARCQVLGRHSWAPAPIGYHPQACRPEKESCPDLVDL